VKPKLAAKCCLRWDATLGATMLLAPERGLVLDACASQIVALLDGTHTLDEIAAHLATTHDGADHATIARDVERFVGELAARGLVR